MPESSTLGYMIIPVIYLTTSLFTFYILFKVWSFIRCYCWFNFNKIFTTTKGCKWGGKFSARDNLGHGLNSYPWIATHSPSYVWDQVVEGPGLSKGLPNLVQIGIWHVQSWVVEDLFWCPKVLQRPQFLVDYQKIRVLCIIFKELVKAFMWKFFFRGAKRNKKW